MNKIKFIITCFLVLVGIASNANETDYSVYESIQDAISKETLEIANCDSSDYEELSQLYVSRAESYLLNSQYEKAIEDFQNAYSQLQYSSSHDFNRIITFRVAFGEAVCYDNLGMKEHTDRAIHQLQAIVMNMECTPCRGQKVSLRMNRESSEVQSKQLQGQDDYSDIYGPNQAPSLGWCEEVVTGVGRAMDAIACLAPNHGVKVVLIGVVEAMITRGVKCCQTGGFWKACAAPISRKWKEWKANKEKHGRPTQAQLPLYVN